MVLGWWVYPDLSAISCANSVRLLQEQKFYDIGASIADVTRSLRGAATQRLNTSVADPKELLWGIVNILSRIRGSQSYHFPSLLQRSSSVFGLESPATMTNTMSFAPHDMPSSATWNSRDAIAASGGHIHDEDHDSSDGGLRRVSATSAGSIPPLVDSLYLA
jgi:hypothetical protein